jgi:putative Mn2+ efflux pump MntP
MFPRSSAYAGSDIAEGAWAILTDLSAGTGQWLTILMMALALGMDAFSLGIGVGMRGVRLRDVLKISLTVGLFHVVMPLMGMLAGHYLSDLLGDVALMAGGLLLVLLGLHMIVSAFRSETIRPLDHRSFVGLIAFALGVSLDSFSVGITLGLFAGDVWFTVMSFGVFGTVMSVLGLLVGRGASLLLGEYSEALGGIILLAFGVKFIL